MHPVELALKACGHPVGTPSASISGGSLASKNALLVACYLKQGAEDIADKQLIEGGHFTSDPTPYLKTGLIAVASEEQGHHYTVGQPIQGITQGITVTEGAPTVIPEPARGLELQETAAIEAAAAAL